MKIRFEFIWYDMWIGAYWNERKRVLYVCPLPMCVFIIGDLPKKKKKKVEYARKVVTKRRTTVITPIPVW